LWKNDLLRLNFYNFVSTVFTASPIDVVMFKFREIRPTGYRRNRALPHKNKQNFVCLSNCTCCADRAQTLPGL